MIIGDDDMIKKLKPLGMFILLLLGMLFFSYLPISLFNIDISKFSPAMKVMYNFACDIGFMLIIFLIYWDTLKKDFKEYFKNFRENFEIAFKFYFIGLLFMIVSNLLIAFFFDGAIANNEETIRALVELYPIYMIFSVSIYAPLVEELIFRKGVKDSVYSFGKSKLTKWINIFLSGFIFASLHVIGSVNTNLDYLYIIPYLSLGMAFSSLYAKTDNIFSSISMHCLHNTVAIIIYLVAGV